MFRCMPPIFRGSNRRVECVDKRHSNLMNVPEDIGRFRSLEQLMLDSNHIRELPKSAAVSTVSTHPEKYCHCFPRHTLIVFSFTWPVRPFSTRSGLPLPNKYMFPLLDEWAIVTERHAMLSFNPARCSAACRTNAASGAFERPAPVKSASSNSGPKPTNGQNRRERFFPPLAGETATRRDVGRQLIDETPMRLLRRPLSPVAPFGRVKGHTDSSPEPPPSAGGSAMTSGDCRRSSSRTRAVARIAWRVTEGGKEAAAAAAAAAAAFWVWLGYAGRKMGQAG
ncbi:protein lap4-like [Tropilaelaps mercedesae]|uniref:Protein lap4-like n=1 Tax=Tropilaelaps mercedesae TaxID=418985 RepID=A0A1V9X5M0_9ACAR|nr:protein lap4-like [Tropilaelaps mercedesae]